MKIPTKLKAHIGRAARALTAALLVSPLADSLRLNSKIDRTMIVGSVCGAVEIAWRQLYPAPDAGSIVDDVDQVAANLARLEVVRAKLDELGVTHPVVGTMIVQNVATPAPEVTPPA